MDIPIFQVLFFFRDHPPVSLESSCENLLTEFPGEAGDKARRLGRDIREPPISYHVKKLEFSMNFRVKGRVVQPHPGPHLHVSVFIFRVHISSIYCSENDSCVLPNYSLFRLRYTVDGRNPANHLGCINRKRLAWLR